MAIGMLSLTKSLLEFSSDFVYSYVGYLFIFVSWVAVGITLAFVERDVIEVLPMVM